MPNHCFIRRNFVARGVTQYKYIHVYLYASNIAQLCVGVGACLYVNQFYTFLLTEFLLWQRSLNTDIIHAALSLLHHTPS
jgi:hypothetical protein